MTRARTPRPAGLTLLAALLCCALAACAPTPHELRPGPLPPGTDLSGRWNSNWGYLVLSQTGEHVVGTSDYNDGRLHGMLTGDLLLFDWEQPGDPSSARMAVQGKGWFRISPDGRSLEGEWGYGQERAGGGTWRATRSRP